MRQYLHVAAILIPLAMAASAASADSLDSTQSGDSWALETPGLSDEGVFAFPEADLFSDHAAEEEWLLMEPGQSGSDSDWLLPEANGGFPLGSEGEDTGN